jgi:hypothetical protein
MNEMIFTTNFWCEFCKKDIPLYVYGDKDSSFPENKTEENEAKEWGEHFHWCDNHRRCAICGDLVQSGRQDLPEGLNLLVNGRKTQIHEKYTKETFERAHKGELLIVHNKCLKKHDNAA